jgi:DNA-binding transcriptional LysR family regulator
MIHLVSDSFGIGLLPVSFASPSVASGLLTPLKTSPGAKVDRLEFSFSHLRARNSRQMEQIRECAEAAAEEFRSRK